jgi:hypothetical protein
MRVIVALRILADDREAKRILDQFEREAGILAFEEDASGRSYVLNGPPDWEAGAKWISDQLDHICPAWRDCLRFIMP